MAFITSNGTGGGNWSSTSTWSGAVVPCTPHAISSVTNSSGLIELTMGSATNWATNDHVNLYGITGSGLVPTPVGSTTPTVIPSTSATTTGTWNNLSTGGYDNEEVHYAAVHAVTVTATASWAFTGLTAGQSYILGLSWIAGVNRANNTPWTVYDSDDATSLGTGNLNQQVIAQPMGPSLGTQPTFFQLIGIFVPSGTSLTVTINNVASASYIIYDAAVCYTYSGYSWPVTKVDSTHFTLQGSTFSGSYTGSGQAYRADFVQILAGDAVTVDASAVDGNNQLLVGFDYGVTGPNVAAITCGTSVQTTAASLTVGTGLTLRLRGDLTLIGENATGGIFTSFTLDEGASLIMDSPSGITYYFNFAYLGQIISNGATNTGLWPDTSGGNHCVITTDTTRSGNNSLSNLYGGLPNTGSVWGGFITHTFTDFSNIGSSTVFGIVSYIYQTNFAYGTKAITLTNCTFTNCNYWISNDEASPNWQGGSFFFNDNLFSSSVLSSQFAFNSAVGFTLHSAPSSSTKQIQRCAFDKLVYFDAMQSITVQGNVFASSLIIGTSAWTTAAEFENNLVVFGASIAGNGFCSMAANYFLFTGSSAATLLYGSTAPTVTNCIFDAETAAANDIFYFPSAATVTLTGNILLEVPTTSKCCGSLFNQSGFTATVEHNLMVGYASVGGLFNMTTPTTGQCTSCRSNILYSTSATNYVAAVVDATPYKLDAITVAGYNAFHNPTSGTNKYNAGGTSVSLVGYSGCEVTNATAFAAEGGGAGNTQIESGFDFTADPTFADSTLRNAAKWNSVVQGGSATYAAAIATLLATPSLIPSMLTWVRAGYVPTNVAFKGATYAGDAFTTDANGNPANGTVGPLGYPTGSLFHQVSMDGLGGGGPYFGNPLSGM